MRLTVHRELFKQHTAEALRECGILWLVFSVLDAEEVRELQEQVGAIHMNEALIDYLMAIVHTTRTHDEVALGVSTRGALTYFKACQALAMVSGRDFVVPDDVKRLAAPVLSHRILMKERRSLRGDATAEVRFIARVVNEVPVPR